MKVCRGGGCHSKMTNNCRCAIRPGDGKERRSEDTGFRLVENETSQDMIIRGGSWLSDAWRCRSAYRGWGDPDDRGRSLGFRLAEVK